MRLFVRPEIDHEHVAEERADELAEFFVIGMLQIPIAVLLAIKREDKPVRAALVVFFGAVVHAPFVRLNLRDLLFQIAEGGFDFLDLILRRGVFKLERDDVAQLARLGRSIGRDSASHWSRVCAPKPAEIERR